MAATTPLCPFLKPIPGKNAHALLTSFLFKPMHSTQRPLCATEGMYNVVIAWITFCSCQVAAGMMYWYPLKSCPVASAVTQTVVKPPPGMAASQIRVLVLVLPPLLWIQLPANTTWEMARVSGPPQAYGSPGRRLWFLALHCPSPDCCGHLKE